MSHLQTRDYEARSMLSFLSRPNWSMMVFTRKLGAQEAGGPGGWGPSCEQHPRLSKVRRSARG